ncbi:hypothetical protein [Streptomyces sp. NBC_01445]|uniref:hypothetical protein n=1 Tax=Streptomyces sp. NBC_01445 TaxID=2903869 RepID=UPI002DD7CBC3|nr:hypothetical protein [Streptomyces sp. NBC_01445]WSE03720.1 hypothetical protein OG574_10255 [Streptomyces sp. NBC_01445]
MKRACRLTPTSSRPSPTPRARRPSTTPPSPKPGPTTARAIWAFIPSAAIAVTLALAPAFSTIAGFSWFVGAITGAVLYSLIRDRNVQGHDVDGETIAVRAS